MNVEAVEAREDAAAVVEEDPEADSEVDVVPAAEAVEDSVEAVVAVDLAVAAAVVVHQEVAVERPEADAVEPEAAQEPLQLSHIVMRASLSRAERKIHWSH